MQVVLENIQNPASTENATTYLVQSIDEFDGHRLQIAGARSTPGHFGGFCVESCAKDSAA